jgi:hypothetical protein
MTDYVLIHGASHGSWCWARVRRLMAAGFLRRSISIFSPMRNQVEIGGW